MAHILRCPIVIMAYCGKRLTTIKRSSAPKSASLSHRARSRRLTATVVTIPSAILACLIRSPPGFGVIVAIVCGEYRR